MLPTFKSGNTITEKSVSCGNREMILFIDVIQQKEYREAHMLRTHYDLTIIGGGSAGLTAAHLAQSLGANVLLIDKERLGGDCLHYGCVPSKSLIHVARVVQQAREAAKLGLMHGA